MHPHPYHISPFDLSTYQKDLQEAHEWEITSNETQMYMKPQDLGTQLMWNRRLGLR